MESITYDIPHLALTRYIAPLREGGSLPALAEAGDGYKYVVKLRGGGPGADYDALAAQLRSFTLLAAGESESPIAALEAHERFRWLTAVRSACIATSRPHPGTTDDLDKTFDRLYQELILRT